MKEPKRVEVRHILLSWRDRIETSPRSTPQEAERRADELVQALKGGADFAQLMATESEDTGGGVYVLVNRGERPGPDEFERGGMVKGFGDASFSLQVGQIAVIGFDEDDSPFGWHIIQRTK